MVKDKVFHAEFRGISRSEEFTDITIKRGWGINTFASQAELYEMALVLDSRLDLDTEDLLGMHRVLQSNLLCSLWLNVLKHCCGMTGLSAETFATTFFHPVIRIVMW